MNKNKQGAKELAQMLRETLRASKPYTNLKLSDGREAVVHEVHGYHIFTASSRANGNSGEFPYYILLEVTTIDGKYLEEPKELAGILSGDLMGIMEHIAVQLSNLPKL
jgi:hypothetical protein